MGTWNSPPQIPPFKQPPFGADQEELQQSTIAYLKQLANIVSALTKDLEYMINGNLDVKNIRADGIQARNIKAGSISADKIQANAVTADKIDVNQLSAITADLGHITAGLIEAIDIFGSYIATSRSYPRCELSNTQNLFGAYGDPQKYVKIDSNPNNLGAPMISFGFNGTETQLMQVSTGFYIFGLGTNITIGVNNLDLGGKVQVKGSSALLGSQSAPFPTSPEETMTSVIILIAALRQMGILA